MPRLCIIHPPQCVGNRKLQCSPIPLGTSWEAGILSFLISLDRDLTQLWSKGLHLSSAGDLKSWSTFWGGYCWGTFTWLSCWNIQPPKHWPRSSLPPMFWFSVITKALWFQSPLILSVLFTLWGSLKTSRFCPNTRSRISWDANPCVPHGGGGSWNGSSSHGSLGLLCLALSQNARIFCDRVYPKEGECDNLKYFWKKHEILSSPQEILLSTGEGSLFPGS